MTYFIATCIYDSYLLPTQSVPTFEISASNFILKWMPKSMNHLARMRGVLTAKYTCTPIYEYMPAL